MQWRIQELTEGGSERGVWGLAPGIFRVSNAVAKPGIDRRGHERG